jgi:hypothetical protein
MGQATSATFFYPTGTVHDEVTTGVEYHDWPPEDANHDGTLDRRFIYGPHVFDVGSTCPAA